jgi:hypothetical protein
MRLDQLEQHLKQRRPVAEANVAAKIKDPAIIKRLGIAMKHDGTLPKSSIAKLGPKPDDQSILALWSTMLDKSLSSTDYGDLSQDGKFDEWLTRLYINGAADYEDINGEGGDALGAWKALSIRGKLKPTHQDFNKFKALRQIQQIVRDRDYQSELRKIKDAEVIEKHKREKKEVTLVDNERFLVVMPFNYGACYTFNNSNGYQANFCTGSSSGLSWFERYSPEGPIISIFDKENPDNKDGKWQMHMPTNQLQNGDQDRRGDMRWNDERFAELFPGLMKQIVDGMTANAEDIKTSSQDIVKGGYDVAAAVADIKKKAPLSFASKVGNEEEPEAEPEAEVDANDGPGTYIVTQTASGRTARIEGESRADIITKLTTRYPDSTEADYTIEKAQD